MHTDIYKASCAFHVDFGEEKCVVHQFDRDFKWSILSGVFSNLCLRLDLSNGNDFCDSCLPLCPECAFYILAIARERRRRSFMMCELDVQMQMYGGRFFKPYIKL